MLADALSHHAQLCIPGEVPLVQVTGVTHEADRCSGGGVL